MEQQFKYYYCRRPHVVVVGAGASRAVMGDLCPTMDEAIGKVGLDNILSGVSLHTKSRNLEAVYSELYNRGEECMEARKEMEDILFAYFKHVTLPVEPTIYDQLLLSLTSKDCVASFNWDGLLIEAYNRVNKITKDLPRMLFLHGNVAAGVCEECKTFGPIVNKCPKCNKEFSQVPLLYPVEHKNYTDNIFIRDQWIVFEDYLERAGMLTVFGYSAPKSDVEASEIMKKAYFKNGIVHQLDRMEIIERPGIVYDEISDTWKYFFEKLGRDYDVVDSFYKSTLGEAPRRSLQYLYKRYIEEGWWNLPSIHLEPSITFSELRQMINPLLIREENNDYEVV